MGEKTGIRWTDATDNPIRVKKNGEEKFGGFYCAKISPGCTNCYAAAMVGTGRFGEVFPYISTPNPPEMYLDREMLKGWSKKGKAKKRFVSSMTDICGEFVPKEWYFEILDAQLAATNQTFLNLSKRSLNMAEWTWEWMMNRGIDKAPPNIWMGFSAENQEWFYRRWGYMQAVAELGFIVWVSAEPLLGEITLPESFLDLGSKGWVIVGGESGNGARPMHPAWVRGLRDQSVEAGVPYFFKQWGEYSPDVADVPPDKIELIDVRGRKPGLHEDWNGYQAMYKVGKHNSGWLLDGVELCQYPGVEL